MVYRLGIEPGSPDPKQDMLPTKSPLVSRENDCYTT